MRWLSRTLGGLTVVVVVAAAILRVQGSPHAPAAFTATLVVFGARLALLVVDVVRRELRWSRLLLPAILLLSIAGLGTTQAASWTGSVIVRLVIAGLCEVAFLAVAIYELRRRARDDAPIEARMARALEALVPPRLAHLIAFELAILGAAWRFALGGWRRPVPAGFTYHRESGLRMLLLALPLLLVGDVLLLELVLLPHAAPWLRIALHALSIYGLVWLVGLYASVRGRPHRIAGGQLALHRGLLGRMTVPVADIAEAMPLPAFADDWKRRAYCAGALRMDIAGPPILELQLRAPARRTGVLGEGPPGMRVLVAVDDPEAFTTALAAEGVTCRSEARAR